MDDVEKILMSIKGSCGDFSLHPITRDASVAGAEYLESEGFRAMTGPETVEGELPDEHGTRHRTPASDGELAIVTVNVDSIGWYENQEVVLGQVVMRKKSIYAGVLTFCRSWTKQEKTCTRFVRCAASERSSLCLCTRKSSSSSALATMQFGRKRSGSALEC